jgi:hypothetical protein
MEEHLPHCLESDSHDQLQAALSLLPLRPYLPCPSVEGIYIGRGTGFFAFVLFSSKSLLPKISQSLPYLSLFL